MKRRKLLNLFLVSTFLSPLLSSSCTNKQKTDTASLILATATTGGTFYPVGVAISTLTNIKLASSDKITMNPINSAGSGENIQLLKNKEVDLAILQGLLGAMAWQGKGNYQGKPQENLRAVTMLWENVEHFVVLREYTSTGNIEDLKNLKGKNFSIGKRGSGTEISGRTILSELGFNLDDDFQLEHIGYGESASALQNGRIAGMNVPAGAPVSAVTQAYAAMGANKLTLLEFTEEQLQKINSTFPVWGLYTIAAGTYPGQRKKIQTIAQPNFLAVHPDIDEQVVYKITKTIYENLPFLNNIHKATLAINLKRAISGLPVPLHSGAVKYYQEVGLDIPKNLLVD
ncbi:MAG: TAXI family TRAP transporter solute-binding subunit [Prochloraceae cyanobacterium]